MDAAVQLGGCAADDVPGRDASAALGNLCRSLFGHG
jgi:hypothetical protein